MANSILCFDGQEYSLEFRAAGRPADYQMEIIVPEQVAAERLGSTHAYVNVFNAKPEAKVEFRVNDSEWRQMEHAFENDPLYGTVYNEELKLLEKFGDNAWPWNKLNEPDESDRSTHLWKVALPAGLEGLCVFEVRAEAMDGKTHTDRRLFRVAPDKAKQPVPVSGG